MSQTLRQTLATVILLLFVGLAMVGLKNLSGSHDEHVRPHLTEGEQSASGIGAFARTTKPPAQFISNLPVSVPTETGSVPGIKAREGTTLTDSRGGQFMSLGPVVEIHTERTK